MWARVVRINHVTLKSIESRKEYFMNNQLSIKETGSPEPQPLLDAKSKNLIAQEQPEPADTMTASADLADSAGAPSSFAPNSVKGGHD
jgi:hypothetical protein